MINATLPPTGKGKRRENTGAWTFKVHPLFLALGAYYAFTGELFAFFISTLVALQHELAHAFAAERLGYKLNRVLLMPYGAVIDGDLSACSLKDEISVALAGPICNFLTSALFIALWWLYPTAYPYTDLACYISFWTGAVNLIPAYPLDGGRVLSALLTRAVGEGKAEKIRKLVSLFIVLGLLALFVAGWVNGAFSLGLLLFCAFLGVGALGAKGGARYEKIAYSLTDGLLRGMEIKRVAVFGDVPLRKTVRFLEKGKFLVIEVYNRRQEKIGEIPQPKLAEFYAETDQNTPLFACFDGF